MKSPRGHYFTPKLVWVTLDKYRRRLRRLGSFKIVHKSENLCVFPDINHLSNQKYFYYYEKSNPDRDF